MRGKEELSLGHEFDVLILKQGEDYCPREDTFKKRSSNISQRLSTQKVLSSPLLVIWLKTGVGINSITKITAISLLSCSRFRNSPLPFLEDILRMK